MKFKMSLAAAFFALTSGPLAALDINAMSQAERDQFRAEVRAYLLDNPEVLMEAIAVLEARQAEEQAAGDAGLLQVNAEEIYNDPTSYVGGNPDGDITIVEFLDYRCGYCKRAHPEVAELIASDGNIRLIVKEFPILGEQSVLASRFAIAVHMVEGDDAYKIVNNELMTMRGNMTEAALSDLSESLGFTTKAVFDAMNSEDVKAVIDRNRALGQRLQINGTPSFIFGDQLVRGYVPLDAMQDIVAEERG